MSVSKRNLFYVTVIAIIFCSHSVCAKNKKMKISNPTHHLFSKLVTSHHLFELMIATANKEDASFLKTLKDKTENVLLPDVKIVGNKMYMSGLKEPIVYMGNKAQFSLSLRGKKWTYKVGDSLDLSTRKMLREWLKPKSIKKSAELFKTISLFPKAFADSNDKYKWGKTLDRRTHKIWDALDPKTKKETEPLIKLQDDIFRVLGAGAIMAVGATVGFSGGFTPIGLAGWGAVAIGGLLMPTRSAEAGVMYRPPQFSCGPQGEGPYGMISTDEKGDALSYTLIQEKSTGLFSLVAKENNSEKFRCFFKRRVKQENLEIQNCTGQAKEIGSIRYTLMEKIYTMLINDCKSAPEKVAKLNESLRATLSFGEGSENTQKKKVKGTPTKGSQ